MKIGTKSILFGAHQFMIHPWFVAAAWWKLYGFPWDPRLWVAFFVHDFGYWGSPNMDGPEGEEHVRLGATVMGSLFDPSRPFFMRRWYTRLIGSVCNKLWGDGQRYNEAPDQALFTWYCFCFYHSRFIAKRYNTSVSMLCYADKLAIALTPWWLYIPMTTLSGEIREYMALADTRTAAGEPKYASMNVYSSEKRQWYANVQEYLRQWVEEHKGGKEDTWTLASMSSKPQSDANLSSGGL